MEGVSLSPESSCDLRSPKGEETLYRSGVGHILIFAEKRPQSLVKIPIFREGNPHFLSIPPVATPGVSLSGLPVFEEEGEVFGYEIQSPLRGHSLQSFREAVYLRLQGGEDLVKERPEGGSPDLLLGVCLFLCHICLWIIYLNKDTISYRILQVITGYYKASQGRGLQSILSGRISSQSIGVQSISGVSQSTSVSGFQVGSISVLLIPQRYENSRRESWIKIPHRGRSGGVFVTAQNTGYPGVCPGLLGPDLPGLRILLSTTLVNRSGPGAGREIAPISQSPRTESQR